MFFKTNKTLGNKSRFVSAIYLIVVLLLIQSLKPCYPAISNTDQISALLYDQKLLSSQINANSKPVCSGGSVSCIGKLTPICSDPGYNPTCLFGNIVDCCKDNGISLDCNSQVPICITTEITTASSSSGSINNQAYCKNNMAYCSSGSQPRCLDLSFTPQCLAGFSSISSVECCKNNGISLYCKPEIPLLCPLTSSQSKFDPVNVDITLNPKLPDIIELPLTNDAFVNRAGFAYSGSNPSFEIKLPTGDSNTIVATVDLKDSSGFIFSNIPFTVTPINGQPEKFILNLSIPDSIKPGETRYALNLSDNTSVNGVIYIFSPLEISVFKGKRKKTKRISKPVITRVNASKIKNKIKLDIKGINFVGKTFLYQNSNNENTVVNNPSNIPNSTVTIFPSSLKAEIKKIVVGNGGKEMKVNFNLPFALDKKTDSVIVISTPSGIVSRLFKLKPGFTGHVNQTIETPGEAFCSNGKVVCTNGLKAFCTNSSYTPKCLAGFPEKSPDCCKEDKNRDLSCNAFLLRCTSK